MNNGAARSFKDEFDQTTESAAAIASIFGWMMNLLARGLGGYIISDRANAKMGMRGRLLVQTICLAAEGALVLVFANTGSLVAAIAAMAFFSLSLSKWRKVLPTELFPTSTLHPLDRLLVLLELAETREPSVSVWDSATWLPTRPPLSSWDRVSLPRRPCPVIFSSRAMRVSSAARMIPFLPRNV